MEAPFIEQHELKNKRLDQLLLEIGQSVQNHFIILTSFACKDC